MDVLTALKGRRSISFFDSSRDVPDETIDELIDINPGLSHSLPYREFIRIDIHAHFIEYFLILGLELLDYIKIIHDTTYINQCPNILIVIFLISI